MRNTFVLSALLGAAGFMQPALAQDRKPDLRERALTREVVAEFGQCAADRRPAVASAYVLKDFDERISDDDWRRLVDRRCMRLRSGELRMDQLSFRGALARQLIIQQLGDVVLSDLDTAPPLAWQEPAAPQLASVSAGERKPLEDAYAQRVQYLYVARLGECLVRRDPAGARRLIEADGGSAGEREAIAALSPALIGCVPIGEQVRLDRATLRAGTAISYYRLAAARGQG